MIDFWEILGHAATDDAFRKSLFAAFAGKMPTADPVNKQNLYSCKFADEDYNTARTLVVGKMGPVSLMALGEWLVVSMMRPGAEEILDSISGIVQPLLAGYVSSNSIFYQALGATMVDSSFRKEFNKRNEATYGFQLSAADRTALDKVTKDGTFQKVASDFHQYNWDCSCKDMCIQWEMFPYAHALEKTLDEMKKKPI